MQRTFLQKLPGLTIGLCLLFGLFAAKLDWHWPVPVVIALFGLLPVFFWIMTGLFASTRRSPAHGDAERCCPSNTGGGGRSDGGGGDD